MKTRHLVPLFTLLALVSSEVSQAQVKPPNRTDLHAAYCVTVLQKFKSMASAAVSGLQTPINGASEVPPVKAAREKALAAARASLNALTAALERIQLYLLPRMPYLDPVGLLAASTAAKKDLTEATKTAYSCFNTCTDSGDLSQRCTNACTRKKMPTISYLRKKWAACRKPSWLPF